MHDIIIIGAGPAGITAAIYALRAGVSVTIFDRNLYGGQAAITAQIENYPAIKSITGAMFAQKLYQQAIDLNANILFEEVISVDFSDAFQTITTNKNTYTAKTVIVATGVKRRELNCEGEKQFAGKGVSYCATCDGAFFRNKNVVVVGGGNTALEDALFLSNQCRNVTLIHRRDTFRAEKHLVDAVLSRYNITILYDSNVKSIKGNHVVNAIDVYHTKQNQTTTIETDGVFIAIGYEPDNEMVSHYLNVNTEGYIVSDEYCHTNIEGVFVAGDTRTKHLRQIITACADGAVAGVSAVSYISTH
ncbi:MAG: thioredoxin-disulfide reductase [Firmicutes bacterium]|jgi:thioredoxin reductase (NADPH)|nr:thioredoxin-disulfide reductase [Bacillota bacterium]